MSHTAAIRFDLRIFLATSALAFGVGCTQSVTPVGDGTGGGDSSPTASTASQGTGGGGVGGAGTSTASTGGAPGSTGLAMLDSQLPDIGSGGADGTSVGVGGSVNDPDALHVFLADTPTLTCGDPYFGPPCEQHWTASFTLAPTQQQPGSYSLESVNGYSAVTDVNGDPDGCSFGGGSFYDGQVQIVSIDATAVTFTLTDTWIPEYDDAADGTYTVPRCFQ